MINIKVRKSSEQAIIPTKAHEHDAGWDMYASSEPTFTNEFIEYDTNIQMMIPDNYVGLIFPRSSITKKDLIMKNSVGVIDPGYQGNIRFRFWKDKEFTTNIYKQGDRIGQIVFVELPQTSLIEVDEFDTTSDRGDGGFGSSGN